MGLGAGAVTCPPGDVAVAQAESPFVKGLISHRPPACKACVTAPGPGYWIYFDLQPSFITSSLEQNEIVWMFDIQKAVQPPHAKSLQSCLTLCNPVDRRGSCLVSLHFKDGKNKSFKESPPSLGTKDYTETVLLL